MTRPTRCDPRPSSFLLGDGRSPTSQVRAAAGTGQTSQLGPSLPRAGRSAIGALLHALADELADHGDEPGVGADRGGPCHRQSDRRSNVDGLGVQIPDHLDVIGNEADRDDHDSGGSAGLLGPQMLADVRFEPWLARWPRSRLVDQIPTDVAPTAARHALSDKPRCLAMLGDIGVPGRTARLRLSQRNRMRGESQP